MNRLWLNACWVTLAALSFVVSPSAVLAATAAREPLAGLADFTWAERANFRIGNANRFATIGAAQRLSLVAIVTDPQSDGEPLASDTLRVHELVSAFAFTRELRGRVSDTHSPRHVARLSSFVPLYDTTTFGGIEMDYLSDLKPSTGQRRPRFLLTSVTLHTRAFGRGIEISATAQNLFNKHYSFPGSTGQVQDTMPQVGRSLRVKLTYRF
jgi:hypothetical protein